MATPTEGSSRVHLVLSWAPLLSGKLDDCLTPDDDSCEGGVAAVAAFLRHFNAQKEPSLVLPFVDKESPFVQMHPLGWSVNRFIFQYLMEWNVFSSTPSLLTQNRQDFDVSFRDISGMQSQQLPFLLTNVGIPPGNSWHAFSVPVHFDETTGLAILVNWNSNEPLNVPQIQSTVGVLDYIARLNFQNGCAVAHPDSDLYENFSV